MLSKFKFKSKQFLRNVIIGFSQFIIRVRRRLRPNPDLAPYEEGKAIRVLFLVMQPAIWPSMSSVWKACRSDPRFSVKVVLVASQYQNERLSQLILAQEMLITKHIPFFYADSFSLEQFKPHIVFVPLPYADMYPPEFSLDAIKRVGGRIAYIPYALEVASGGYNIQYQFNLLVQQTAWRIFIRSERHSEIFARYCNSGCGHVVVTGHPKFDHLQDEQENRVDALEKELKNRIGGRPVILWTPHFSVEDPPVQSTFTLVGKKIFSLFTSF